jgi:hypothetical protein
MKFPVSISSPSGRSVTLERDADFPDDLMLVARDGKERMSVIVDRAAAMVLGAVLLEWGTAQATETPA